MSLGNGDIKQNMSDIINLRILYPPSALLILWNEGYENAQELKSTTNPLDVELN
jgi:hypothetical protein